jgi:hypothetical protein
MTTIHDPTTLSPTQALAASQLLVDPNQSATTRFPNARPVGRVLGATRRGGTHRRAR